MSNNQSCNRQVNVTESKICSSVLEKNVLKGKLKRLKMNVAKLERISRELEMKT